VSTGVAVFSEEGDVGIRLNKQVPTLADLVNGPCYTHASTMLRTPVLRAVQGYTVAFYTYKGQDYDLWMRLHAAGFQGYNLQEPLYRVLEDTRAYQRKKKYRLLHGTILRWKGFRKMKVPLFYYPFVLKPILVGALPIGLLKRLQEARWAHTHQSKQRKEGEL
jgi:glycosyltransferase EpsE